MLIRQQIYTLLIVISAALMLGRILAVNRVDTQLLQKSRLTQIPQRIAEKKQRLQTAGVPADQLQTELDKTERSLQLDAKLESPVFSANDRSRWDTIRALVEPDMRVTRQIQQPDGTLRSETIWYAIDKAQNVKGWDTIDMVKHDLPGQPGTGYLFSSKPPLLPTVLAIPYAAMYWGSNEKLSLEHEPFLVVRVTLIVCNLLPLVFCWFLLARLIERFGTTDWGKIFSVAFVCFGTFLSTFSVTLNNHIPAVICITIAFYAAVRIVYDDEVRWRYFLAAGFFGTFAAACELPALLFGFLIGFRLLCLHRNKTLFGFLPAAMIVAAAFFVTNYIAHKTLLPAYSQPGWYIFDYERDGKMRESYWKNPVGIDRGEPSRWDYVFHSTIGHHGLFSLTPVWALSFIGLGIWLFRREHFSLAIIILLTSLTVFAFYMAQSQPNRNYGGMTSALRWMFWFAPLWSVPLVTAADSFSRYRFCRAIAILCLIASAMSAAYPIWNPWTMPWTYYLLQ